MTVSAYYLNIGGVWLELPEIQADIEIQSSRASSSTVSVGGVVRTQVAPRSSRVWPFQFAQDARWRASAEQSLVRYLALAAQGLVGDVFLYDAAAAQVNMLDPRDCIGRDSLQPTILVNGLIPLRTFAAGYTLSMSLRGGVTYHLSGTTSHTAAATLGTYNIGAGAVNIVAPAGSGARRWSTSFTALDPITYAWTGAVNTSTSTATVPGPVVRTNIATNPRAIAGAGGWLNTNAAKYATAFVTSGFPAHPLGITTALQGHVLDAVTDISAMLLAQPDNIAAAGSPARRLGVWVCSMAAGYQVAAYGGFPATPLTAGVWTFVQQTTTTAAGAQSYFRVTKVTGNAVSTDMVYATGSIAEAGDTVGDYFDGWNYDIDGTVAVIPTVAGVTSGLRLTEGNVDNLDFLPGMKAVCQVSVSDPQQTLSMVFADRLPLSDYSVILREVG